MIGEWNFLTGGHISSPFITTQSLSIIPFLFVQIAAFPDGDNLYAELRWSQSAALNLAGVGVATGVDLGDPSSPYGSIHPRSKQQIGERLALSSFRTVYPENPKLPNAHPAIISFHYESDVNSHVVTVYLYLADSTIDYSLQSTSYCSTCCTISPFELFDDASSSWVSTVVSYQSSPFPSLQLIANNIDSASGVRYDWSDYPQCALYRTDTFLPMLPFIMPFNDNL